MVSAWGRALGVLLLARLAGLRDSRGPEALNATWDYDS
jgi:hypothetical protein